MGEAECLKRQALAKAAGSHGWKDGEITLDDTYFWGGEFAQALQGYERQAVLYAELGLEMRLVEATSSMAWCLSHLGRYERAHALAQSNLERCVQAGYRLYRAMANCAIAHVALGREEPATAHRLLLESVRLYRETVGGGGDLAVLLAHLGCAERALGHKVEARGHLSEALHMAVEGRHWVPLLATLPRLALLLADGIGRFAPDIERAVELYALASRYPFVANSHWFEDVAGRHIVSAAAALPPEVVAAAQERGRARDLWATAEELLEELDA
jgi:tetratricopeptide (TPR) repeat protein